LNSSELTELIKLAPHVYIIGNGGSYANAMHICNDLLSVGVRAYCIDPSTLTAFSNDYGYEKAFARWIGVVGERDDLLIALSGSGKSQNILKAILMAEARGMKVWREFGKPQNLNMQKAEEWQIELGHKVMMNLK